MVIVLSVSCKYTRLANSRFPNDHDFRKVLLLHSYNDKFKIEIITHDLFMKYLSLNSATSFAFLVNIFAIVLTLKSLVCYIRYHRISFLEIH